MTVQKMQQEILRLKKGRRTSVFWPTPTRARRFWRWRISLGIPYGLSLEAAKVPQKGVLMCGVRFMAETCKILNPGKKVLLANPLAGCPMAEQMDVATLRKLRRSTPAIPSWPISTRRRS